jgi:hypothetical protein
MRRISLISRKSSVWSLIWIYRYFLLNFAVVGLCGGSGRSKLHLSVSTATTHSIGAMPRR